MAKRPPTIPDSELDVLKVLWDRGQATVREVLETLRAAGRQWSYATGATLLDRLETKGVVTSDRSELAFVYRPAISTQEVRQKRVNNLVDKLYQGEPGLLVLHLLKSHPLDPRQAKEVRSMLEEMTGEASRKKGAEGASSDCTESNRREVTLPIRQHPRPGRSPRADSRIETVRHIHRHST